MKQRIYYQNIWEELSTNKSMIFLAGPRQSGKTTLAQIISKNFTNHLYFNWDIQEDRKLFLSNPLFFEQLSRVDHSKPFIIFDEIHKYKEWKNYLKGVYDQHHDRYRFLVSGSGRLDLYQKGGDSLAGRYFMFHLWPFTIGELCHQENYSVEEFLNNPLQIRIQYQNQYEEIWQQISTLSGFPEPFLSSRETTYRRWSKIYSQQLIREDIRDLTQIKSIGDLENLYLLLPDKIGSPLSVSSLSEDLHVSYNSINQWLDLFERFYISFTIRPWSKKIARAVHKERKLYIWDVPRIKNPGAKFENMVAIELYRTIISWNDIGYGNFSLHYIKNKEKQEVDFIIANDNEPFLLIETKLSVSKPSKALIKFQNQLNIPAVQLVLSGNSFKQFSNNHLSILVCPASLFFANLP
ncbi:ATPase AAA [Candidatus Magnetomorum sp. HK-1]|nr:ATPase AAA [Candidatus Magnetomorum sp. HK-1]